MISIYLLCRKFDFITSNNSIGRITDPASSFIASTLLSEEVKRSLRLTSRTSRTVNTEHTKLLLQAIKGLILQVTRGLLITGLLIITTGDQRVIEGY